MYTFPWSFLGEGVEGVLADVGDRAGCDGVAVAFNYHTAKFLHPRPHPHFHFTERVTAYFPPSESAFAGARIQPLVGELARARDVLAEVRAATYRRGMRLHAWLVCLHSTLLGDAYPDTCVRTAFGDRLPFALSPSHPDVREYLCRLVADVVASYAPERVELESIEYVPSDHGYHHELDGVRLDEFHRSLFGLDFSELACRDLASLGVDPEAGALRVRQLLDSFLRGPSRTLTLAQGLESEPQIASLFEARAQIVAGLVDEVRSAGRQAGGSAIEAMLSTWGRPVGGEFAEGHRAALLGSAADGLIAPLYFDDTAQMSEQLGRLRHDLGGLEGVTAILLMLERQDADDDFFDRAVATVAKEGVGGINFYHHALVRKETFDVVARALRRLSPR